MTKPHILFITTDEQHLRTISAFGAKTHKTPNIDRILARSDVYENAYSVSPVCLPTRCSWMTGMYPHKSGAIGNWYGASISREFPNLFTELKKQGYYTSLHGKCHFVPVPYAAVRGDLTLEYEHFITFYKSLGMDVLNLQDDKNNSMWFYDDYAKEMEGLDLLTPYREAFHNAPHNQGICDFPGPAHKHPDSWVGKKAADFILNSDANTPQFVWTSFSGPHWPNDTPREYIDKVDMSKDSGRIFKEGEWTEDKYHYNGFYGPGTTEGSGSAAHGAQKTYSEDYWNRWRKSYFGNVILIDEWIGSILDAADKKWGDNYCVIFTSDHGDMMGNHSLWGKNGSLYEDVLRVPLAVSRPGQKERNNKSCMVSSLDVFPTILDQAGAPLPVHIDGTPLAACSGREYIISECADRVAVVQDGWKLHKNRYERTGHTYYELYNLREDPNEFINEYENPSCVVWRKKLEAILLNLEKEESLLSTVFYDKKNKPYWFNGGNGAGYLHNGIIPQER